MKKLLLSAGLAFAMLTAFSQKSHVNFGLKGGLNFTTFSSDDNANYDYKTGFNVGGLLHVHITERFAFQPELFYSLEGAALNLPGTTDKLKANLSYVRLPLLLQIMTGSGLRFALGPQLGILTSARQKNGSTSIDVKNSYKSTEAGLVGGVGFVFKNGLGIDARYNYGLSKINAGAGSDVKNRGFAVGLFYHLNAQHGN